MRKLGVFLSLCAGVILSASLCVNVLLYQRLAETGSLKKQQKRSPKNLPGKRKMPVRGPASVRSSAQKKDLLCLSASGSAGQNNRPMIRLCFNKWNVDWAKNHSLISVKPAVKIRFSNYYDEIRLHGDFEYEKEYTVLLKKGIRSDSGDILEHDLAFRVRIPALPSSVRFVSDGMIYPAGRKELFLPVEVTNLKQFRVRVYELYENNLTRFTLDSWDSTSLYRNGRLISDKQVQCSPVRNRVTSFKLKLSDHIKDCRSGVYAVGISHGSYFSGQCRVINLTDLSCSISLDPTAKKAFVAVRALKNSSPEVKATVTLISEKHQVLARGKTGQNGIVFLDYSRSGAGQDREDSPGYLVVRSAAGKVTILRDIAANSHSLAPFQNQGMVYTGQIRAFLYTERGIYRPGERLFLNLFLRNARNQICSGLPCTVKVRDPKGNTVYSARRKSSPGGFVSVDFVLPAESRNGSYEAVCIPDRNADDLVWGKTSFLVSDFTPDRIKVQLKSSGETLYKGGGKLSFDVSADHYYGAPLEKAPCRIMVTARKAPLPASWEGWSVGDEAMFRAGKTDSSARQLLKGKRSFTYKGFEEGGGLASFPVLLCASAQVRDPGGRTVTARRNVLYHPLEYYIGLREGKDPAQRAAAVEWKLLAPPEKKISGKEQRSWKVSLFRLEWHSVMRKVSSDLRLDWELRKVPVPGGSTSFRSSAAEGVWKRELESGQYEIVFEEGTRRSVLQFFHWRGDDSPRSTNPSVIHCFADRKIYKGGDVASLTFHSAGEGSLLVTMADPRLLSMKSVKVKPGKNTVRVRIPSSVPGSSFYCALTLVSGEKRQFALVHLPVDQSARRLSVSLQCPGKAEPGKKVSVKISLKNSAGNPISGTVQLFAVDEGILSLTGYRTPDIFGFFFGRYRCGLTFADAYSTLYPELRITSSGRFGGDRVLAAKTSLNGAGPEGEDPSRHAPRSVVCMLPPVEVNGSGQVELEIPDHLGTLRLMAVSSGRTAVGSASRNIVVRARADMEIAGPRVCAPSDKAQLTFTLLNSDIPGGKGLFRANLPSGKVYEKKVKILPGKSLVLRIPVQMPPSAGICRIPCELALGSVTRKKVFSCGVRLPAVPVRHTLMRLLKPGERFLPGRELLKADLVSVENCSLNLSPSPAEALRDALNFLNTYPYGCLEQTVSGVFPYLALKDLARYNIITPEMEKASLLKLKSCIRKIRSMMLYSGAFPMWQGMDEPWISGSVFASHFLWESKGLEASAGRRNQLFLRSVASRKSAGRYERAYAVYVLSLMKDPSSVKYARDLLDPAKDDFASLLAAFALLERSYAGEGAVHLKRLLGKGVFLDSSTPHFTSEASRKGMVLYLLMKYAVEKKSASVLALDLIKLLRRDSSSWGVTHANAWAVLGLASFLRESGPVGKGKVLVREYSGGKGKVCEVSRSLDLPVKKSVLGTLEVENVSTGSVFVRLSARGQGRMQPASGKGMTLKRVYFNSRGKAVSHAAQGELLTVELTLTARGPLKDLVISDMLPGGLEIEDDSLQTRMKMQKKYDQGILDIKHVEKRNGLMVLCADLSSGGTGRFRYQVRAVTRGSFASGQANAEGMYDPETFARTGGEQKAFEVR